MTGRRMPAPLTAGDRVGIVCPAGPASVERMEQAKALLRSWELVPVPSSNVLARHPRASYLAGTDTERAADLQEAWCDDTLKAVFCARGGYGSVRLLDLLEVDKLRAASPKALFGSSDITALHEFWSEQLDLATWFSPMVGTDAVLGDDVATEDLRRAVFGQHPGEYRAERNARVLVPGTAAGELTGGNLSLLAMTTGARERQAKRAEGKIVLLEDVTEELYRLDALLHILVRSGYFDGAAGIVLGTWMECGELTAVLDLIDEVLSPLGIPLAAGFPLGHGPSARSIPLGVRAELRTGEESVLTVDAARI